MGLVKVHKENFEKVATTKAEDKKTQTSQENVEEYKDVFEGELGTLSGKQHFDVDATELPNIAPLQHVPLAIKPMLKAALERLTDTGVLMPVDEPTD